MTTQTTLITAEELLCLPATEGRRELIDGKVVEMAPPGIEHGWIMSKAGWLLRSFVQQHDLGDVFEGDVGIILARNPDRVCGPDVCFFARGRLPDKLPRGYADVVPDLVVEIVSPNDAAGDVREKTNEWLRAGVRLVLTLYPGARTVVAETADSARVLHEADTLTGDPVLPGFSTPVVSLFP